MGLIILYPNLRGKLSVRTSIRSGLPLIKQEANVKKCPEKSRSAVNARIVSGSSRSKWNSGFRRGALSIATLKRAGPEDGAPIARCFGTINRCQNKRAARSCLLAACVKTADAVLLLPHGVVLLHG